MSVRDGLPAASASRARACVGELGGETLARGVGVGELRGKV